MEKISVFITVLKMHLCQFYIWITFQEISFDVFLQVKWEDQRVHHRNNTIDQKYIELKLEERHKLWVIIDFQLIRTRYV